MDYGPLVMEEIDAGGDLAREFGRYVPVKAAFWVKACDEGQRYLYLASDKIDGTNIDVGYGEVMRIVDKLRTPHLDPFRVKLVSGVNPLTRAAVDITTRFPGPMATRFGGALFGGVVVDDVYIYPSPLPAAV